MVIIQLIQQIRIMALIEMMKQINTKYYIKFSYYKEVINFVEDTYHVDIKDTKSIFLQYDYESYNSAW